MCAPLVVVALMAASAYMTYASQKKAADEQRDYSEQVYRETAVAANDSYMRGANDIAARLIQEKKANAQQAEQVSRAGAEAAGASSVGAAESGGGRSVDLLFQNLGRQEASARLSLATNYGWVEDQSMRQLGGLRADAANRIVSARPAPINNPNPYAHALQFAAQAASYYGAYSKSSGGSPKDPYGSDVATPQNNGSNWPEEG